MNVIVQIFNSIVRHDLPPAATVIWEVNLDMFAEKQSLVSSQSLSVTVKILIEMLIGADLVLSFEREGYVGNEIAIYREKRLFLSRAQLK